MNLGKKSYSSRWGHERTHYVTNPAKKIRRTKALGRLVNQLNEVEEYVKRLGQEPNSLSKEALLEAAFSKIGRINKEILTLKSRI